MWGIHVWGCLVGMIAVMDMNDKPALFYAIHPSYRCRGYMKESIHCLLCYLRESEKCEYVYTEVSKDNIPSMKLLENEGFKIIDKNQYKFFLRYEMPTLRR